MERYAVYLGTFVRERSSDFGTVINIIRSRSSHGKNSSFQEEVMNELFYKFIDSPLTMENLPPINNEINKYRPLYIGNKFPYNMAPSIKLDDLIGVLKKFNVEANVSVDSIRKETFRTVFLPLDFLSAFFIYYANNPKDLLETIEKYDIQYELAAFKKSLVTMRNVYLRSSKNEDFEDGIKEILGEDCVKYLEPLLRDEFPRC